MPEFERGSGLEKLVYKLENRLNERWARISKFDAYYRGDHEMKFASTKFVAAFGRMFLDAADNWMPLVVSAPLERLTVQGFRLGNSTSGDRRLWDIWQANDMDAQSVLLFREALINGMAYTMVSPFLAEGPEGKPLITVEHPSQMIGVRSAANRRVRIAALKVWVNEDERKLATLYTPDFVYKLQGTHKGAGARFEPRETNGEAWPLPNPLGVVSVVPIENQQRMLGEGESELTGLLPTQDRINKLSFDMMIAAEYAAYRQRYGIGIKVETDPETGKPVAPFEHAVDRLWVTSNPNAKFGEFEATDLSNYVKGIETQVQHLAAQSRTPPHYLLGQSGAFPSGESLKSTETGLNKKVGGHQMAYGDGLEETGRLALRVAGINARGASSMETVWADPESRTESEHVDSIVKKLALGVPLRQLWEDIGYSQETIDRFLVMLREEAEVRQLTADRNSAVPEPIAQ